MVEFVKIGTSEWYIQTAIELAYNGSLPTRFHGLDVEAGFAIELAFINEYDHFPTHDDWLTHNANLASFGLGNLVLALGTPMFGFTNVNK